MRAILNISVPVSMMKEIKAETKAGGFASVSEFIRHLLREWKRIRLAYELDKERLSFEKGNYKTITKVDDFRRI